MKTKNTMPMTISKELFDEWTRLTRSGDITKLMEITGLSNPTIKNALTYGHVNKNSLAISITAYFMDRKASELEQAESLKQI